MRVKLLKDHLGRKAGDVIDTTTERANYFIRTGVAETEIGKKEDQGSKYYKTKEEKPGRKTK